MKELVFATILAELKKSWGDTVTDPDLINLLYDSVADPVGLTNRNGEPITVSKGTASKIVNRQPGGNPHRSIRKYSTDDRVTSSIANYFSRNIVKRLLKGSEDDLIERLKAVIREDSGIAETKKQELLKNAQKNTLALFLASAFLYSVSRENVATGSSENKSSANTIEIQLIPVPTGITGVEGSYTDALLAAYGQAEHIKNFTADMLDKYPTHKQNFSNQRKYFFAAEAVRRGTRDLYRKNEKDQFEVLKDEMYEGVTEIWEDEAKNGLARMRKVLTQATNTSLDKCSICRDTEWISNSVRKGVCHFLVGENRLKGWVRDDDGQAI